MSIGFDRTRVISPVPTRVVSTDVVPIVHGGTGATTPLRAVTNLGGISTCKLNMPNHPASLDENGHLDYAVFDDVCGYNRTVEGPTKMYVGQTAVFKITNFSSFYYGDTGNHGKLRLYNGEYMYDGEIDYGGMDYTQQLLNSVAEFNIIKPINGGELFIDEEYIYYTAPNKAGIAGFSIGDTKYLIEVSYNGIEKPYFFVPEEDYLSVPIHASFLSSDFMSSRPEDTHTSTDWQIAKDSLFTIIDRESMFDEENLVGWDVENLEEETTYYIRVRYRSGTEVSDWSDPLKFITTLDLADGNTQTIQGMPNERLGNVISTDENGTRVVVCGAPYERYTDAIYVYRAMYGSYTLEHTIRPQYLIEGQVDALDARISNDGEHLFIIMKLSSGDTCIQRYTRSEYDWVYDSEFYPNLFFLEHFDTYSIDVSKEGNRVIVGCPELGIAYIFLKTGTEAWVAEGQIRTTTSNFGGSVDISHDGTRCVVASDEDITVYSLEDDRWICTTAITLEGMNRITDSSLSFSGDGKTIYFCNTAKDGYIWKEIDDQWKVYARAVPNFYNGKLNTDGSVILAQDEDGYVIRQLNPETGIYQIITTIDIDGTNKVIAMSGTGRNIFISDPTYDNSSGKVDVYRCYLYNHYRPVDDTVHFVNGSEGSGVEPSEPDAPIIAERVYYNGTFRYNGEVDYKGYRIQE